MKLEPVQNKDKTIEDLCSRLMVPDSVEFLLTELTSFMINDQLLEIKTRYAGSKEDSDKAQDYLLDRASEAIQTILDSDQTKVFALHSIVFMKYNQESDDKSDPIGEIIDKDTFMPKFAPHKKMIGLKVRYGVI